MTRTVAVRAITYVGMLCEFADTQADSTNMLVCHETVKVQISNGCCLDMATTHYGKHCDASDYCGTLSDRAWLCVLNVH